MIVSGIVTAYLIGSFSPAVFFGKWFFDIDVREHGSGNAGATNTIRVLGVKIGLAVLLVDVFKGWFAVSLASLFSKNIDHEFFTYLQLCFAFSVVLGHIFPLYTSFRGGKGVATLLGVGFALFPVASLIVLGWFVVVLLLFRYVSLGSVTGAILFPVLVNLILTPAPPIPLAILSILVGIAVPLTHQKNIRRLLKGEESKFKLRQSQPATEEKNRPIR